MWIAVLLYSLHLFTTGGFGASVEMLVDDVRMLVACPSKPDKVVKFLFRQKANTYSYFATDIPERFGIRTVNVHDHGALDAICDGVFYRKFVPLTLLPLR